MNIGTPSYLEPPSAFDPSLLPPARRGARVENQFAGRLRTRGSVRRMRKVRFRLALLADAELADQFAITLDVLRPQIIEQTTALADQLEKPPARVMILRVNLEMLGQVRDALGQKRNLHFWRAGVAAMGREFPDDFLLAGRCQTHVDFCLAFFFRSNCWEELPKLSSLSTRN